MKHFVVVLLCLALIHSQNPNCDVKDGKSIEKTFLYANELQAFNLGSFFSGYNLLYSATGLDMSFQLIQHFYQNDIQPINQTDSYSLIDFDVYTDGNLAWNNKASSLGLSLTDSSYYIKSGKINDKMNVVIDKQVKLDTTESSICFDHVILTDTTTAIDCQNFETKTNYLYLFDHKTNMTTPNILDSTILSNDRKDVVYRITGNRTYLLVAWLGRQMVNQQDRYKSFIHVYYLDSSNVPILSTVINATTLQVQDLSISDITVDAIQNIYVTDERGTLIQFSFNGTHVILGKKKNFNTPLYKVSVHVTENLVHLTHVVGDHYIYEINLDTDSSSYNYLLPNNIGSSLLDFQTNNELLIVQTDHFYYIYKRHQTSLNNIHGLIVTNRSQFALSPRTPNLIVLNLDNSISFITSDGFLLIDNTKALDQIIQVTATSQQTNGSNPVKCSAQFVVKTVTQDERIYEKRDFNTTVTAQNPAYEVYRLDNFFAGSRLTYETQPNEGVTLNLQYIQDLTINSDTPFSTPVNFLDTFTYDIAAYYKIFTTDSNLYIQDCKYNGDIVDCKISRKIDFNGAILYHEFFMTTVDLKNNIPVLAYVTKQNQEVVNFIQLNSDKNFAGLTVDPGFNISDIDANQRYVYVTVKSSRRIFVYKNDLSTYELAFKIDQNDIPYDHAIFYPRQTILSPTDINVLVIKNLNSIIIMKITAFTREYVSQIPIDELETSDSKIIVAKSTLLVFISRNQHPDQIRQYGGYDIYHPIEMRKLDLINKHLSKPIQAFPINDGSLVAVKTNQLNIPTFLTLIRTGQSKVSSILVDIPIGKDSLATLAGLQDSGILEISSKITSQNLNKLTHSMLSKRYFYRPLLIARAQVSGKFKDNFSFGLIVKSPQTNLTTTRTITVYNVKSQIEKSSVTPDKINFPTTANSEKIQKQIKADSYFQGPVAKYSIQCPYCDDKITLKDHVTALGAQKAVNNIKAFYYFQDKGRLWGLTDKQIEVLDSNLVPITSIPFNIDTTNTQVLNWYVDKNGVVEILITRVADGSQFFLSAVPSQNKQSADFKQPVYLDKNPGIKYAQNIKSINNRIFIHDIELNQINIGVVHVFTRTVQNDQFVITFESTIDYVTFGQALQIGINDFELIDIPQSGNNALFLATVGNLGLGYFSFNTSQSQFIPTKINTYNLSANQIIESQLIDDTSNYLQLEVINSNINLNSIELNTIITIQKGQHQLVVLKFKQDQDGYIYQSLSSVTTFGKYGKESVLNWATTTSNKNGQTNVLLIAHQGKNNIVSIGIYNLDYQSASDIQEMIGAIQSPVSSRIQNFANLLFRDGNNLKSVQSIIYDNQGSPQLFNISKSVSIVYKYEQPGDFNTIKLIATNQYGSAFKNIQVNFERPNQGKGLAWYIILIIILGGLLVVGLIVLVVMKQRRKKLDKDSLLSASKNDSDED